MPRAIDEAVPTNLAMSLPEIYAVFRTCACCFIFLNFSCCMQMVISTELMEKPRNSTWHGRRMDLGRLMVNPRASRSITVHDLRQGGCLLSCGSHDQVVI